MQSPWVRIAIVNFNSGAWLQKVIDGLERQTYDAFEVVIIDNASSDDSFLSLRIPDERFTLCPLDENTGFAAANNRAFAGAVTPWYCTLNPDCVPEPCWLEEAHLASEKYPSTDMFGSTQLIYDDPKRVDGFGDFLSFYGIPWRALHGHDVSALPADDIEAFSPCAAAAFYRSEAYQKAGGFAEEFFCYLEDVDLGWRLQRQGVRCIQLRRAVVHHKGSLTTVLNSPFCLFHSQRNRIWMVRRNMPPSLAVVSLILGAMLYIPILVFKYDQPGRRAALKGVAEGLSTSAPKPKSQSAPLWAGIMGLLRRGAITINPYTLSKKALPFVRKAVKYDKLAPHKENPR